MSRPRALHDFSNLGTHLSRSYTLIPDPQQPIYRAAESTVQRVPTLSLYKGALDLDALYVRKGKVVLGKEMVPVDRRLSFCLIVSLFCV